VKKERPPRKITTGYRANVPFQRVSATKVRRIADNVRRKPYVEAIALLDVLPHKGARLLRKLIQSAAANALAQNKNLDESMLYVKELLIDVGPTMKRMWARGAACGSPPEEVVPHFRGRRRDRCKRCGGKRGGEWVKRLTR